MTDSSIKVLAFDVFGTVVDWHGSIAAEVEAVCPEVSGGEFARAWRAGYRPAMDRVSSGDAGWTILDDLHRTILDEVLMEFGVNHLSESEKVQLNLAWHRLLPWPDTVPGLQRMKVKFPICTLSNGNVSLLVDMARYSKLPWDCILGAEVFRKYKPDPDTYLGVARMFRVEPGEVMLVAAHHDDLVHARTCGLRTAYIERPLEFGADQIKDVSPVSDNTYHARSFEHLADQLGC